MHDRVRIGNGGRNRSGVEEVELGPVRRLDLVPGLAQQRDRSIAQDARSAGHKHAHNISLPCAGVGPHRMRYVEAETVRQRFNDSDADAIATTRSPT